MILARLLKRAHLLMVHRAARIMAAAFWLLKYSILHTI